MDKNVIIKRQADGTYGIFVLLVMDTILDGKIAAKDLEGERVSVFDTLPEAEVYARKYCREHTDNYRGLLQ